jgi:hypothetical protein
MEEVRAEFDQAAYGLNEAIEELRETARAIHRAALVE